MSRQNDRGNGCAPAYVHLHRSGSLAKRVERGLQSLERCRVCPWDCGINRLKNEYKICRIGRFARVASYFPHFGEEDCLRGWNGSGTIFFGSCNLKCVFCQNADISHQVAGEEVDPRRLAEIMLLLQNQGCHNINWVTPEHVVPQILEALPYAIDGGLRLPIVYNTSAYDSLESLQLMDGIVDIYMPDFKYWTETKARRVLKARAYPQAARAAIQEMHRQVGDLAFDDSGLARRGLLVRHLVMPGEAEETRAIMDFLAREISPATYVNVMGQYYPAGKVGGERYAELNRRLVPAEIETAVSQAAAAGLYRIDRRRDR